MTWTGILLLLTVAMLSIDAETGFGFLFFPGLFRREKNR
jgi:hypothetical protein